jgi:mersacidin/lichenicidin family type 2 lantibiotic
MKFDIVRAWKDESYRHSLSEEQRQALPANPAGELSDEELNAVTGGSWSNWDNGAIGGSSSSAASSHHTHSYAVIICDLNLFSNDVAVIALQDVLNIGSPRKEICAQAG